VGPNCKNVKCDDEADLEETSNQGQKLYFSKKKKRTKALGGKLKGVSIIQKRVLKS